MLKAAILQYLEALERADIEALLLLFAEGAIVDSPLYGMQGARAFYTSLLADTQSSKLSVLDIFTDDYTNAGAVNFWYEWTMRDGSKTEFDCVDIFNFDKNGKIRSLKIIYDTASTRPLFESLHPSSKT